MSILGGIAGIGASIFGGISASKAMRRVRNNIKEAQAENETWYNRRYNEDATERADAQRILELTRENIRQRNQAAAGAVVMGGATEEAVAAARAANNEVEADAMSQIAAAGERRKDAVEQQYLNTRSSLQGQLNNMEVGKAQAVTQAVAGVADAASNLGHVF